MDQFYLTLPSNSSMKYFPDNTLTSYMTKLPQRMNLEGHWEVSLCEITYPHTWSNLSQDGSVFHLELNHPINIQFPLHTASSIDELVHQMNSFVKTAKLSSYLYFDHDGGKIKISVASGYVLTVPEEFCLRVGFFLQSAKLNSWVHEPSESVPNTMTITDSVIADDKPFLEKFSNNDIPTFDMNLQKKEKKSTITVQISPGFYTHPVMLIKNLNKAMYKMTKQNIEYFSHDNITHLVSIHLVDDFYRVILSDELKRILGFSQPVLKETMTATNILDLQAGFWSLFVYTDIIESTMVGDTFSPLLRTVQIQGRDGEMVTSIYNAPFYKPLLKHHFDTIGIYLRDDKGEPISFERGRVIVTLHFRRRTL